VNRAIWGLYVRRSYTMIEPRSRSWSAERWSGKTCSRVLVGDVCYRASCGQVEPQKWIP
jgi:hypothetical protein